MEQSELLIHLCQHLHSIGVRYFITGSQATIAFGEPRFTNDIDVVIDLNETNYEAFCTGFPQEEYYLNRETVRAEINRQGMFNIIHPHSGLKIDVIIPKADSVDQLRFKRAVHVPLSGDCTALFSSPEDIILQKLKWHQMGGGERHLRDIAGILRIRGDSIDQTYIEQHSTQLGVSEIWQSVSQRVE